MKIGTVSSGISYEPGIFTGILHPKMGQLYYNVMFPDASAFRQVPHQVYSQFWTYSWELDHCALHTHFSKCDQIASLHSCWITLSLKKLRCSLLQRHPVSVTSLWLPILTLIFRNTLSLVYIASYQAISQITKHEFTTKHKFMQSLYTCFVHLFSAFPSKIFQNYNLLFIHIKNETYHQNFIM